MPAHEEVYVTSHDPEDDGSVEFWMPRQIAHLSPYLPEGTFLEEDQYLVFTLKLNSSNPEDFQFTAVINRGCNNLSAEDIKKHEVDVNKASWKNYGDGTI